MLRKSILVVLITISILLFTSCGGNVTSSDKPQVVVTTMMLTDVAKVIGGDKVEITGLMGPGIDPHLYKASAGDVGKMQNADMIVYNGLHLEGKMGEIFENLSKMGKLIVEASNGIDNTKVIMDENESKDPHIWFDVALFKVATKEIYEGFIKLDSKNKEFYTKNYQNYISELDNLDEYIKGRVNEIPKESRVLITAHDAFSYFGKAYGFEVKGLQGISTAAEAGTLDVSNLANFISERKIKAIFVETSVQGKTIEALREAVDNKGFSVKIGGTLYSDSLGSPNTQGGTYIGSFRHNIDTIVNALK